MPEDFERTEPATPRRREEARRKGMVPQSGDLPMAMVLGLGILGLLFFGPRAFGGLRDLMAFVLSNLWSLDLASLGDEVGKAMLKLILPFLGLSILGALAGNLIPKGFVLSLEPLKPQLSRINPVEGFKRFFTLGMLIELLKAGIKVGIVGAIAYVVLKGKLRECPALIEFEPYQIGTFTGISALGLMGRMAIAFLALSLLEVCYHRWDYERKLRMTREELKEEMKQHEGDPKVKARIRSTHRRFVRHRMIHRVKEADVVVTNPTRLAVALMYRRQKMKAPVVVAKGRGWLAQRIREVALQAGVPIVQNRPLAEVLYRSVEVGQPIPVELYRAVAEILAWVYRLRGIRA